MSEDEFDFWGSLIEEWEAYGLRCRTKSGLHCLCGYVQIPPRLFTKESVARVLSVHYGITFGPDRDGWVGFDTGHAYDYWAPDDLVSYLDEFALSVALTMQKMAERSSYGRRWTMEKLKAETEQLAQQIAVALDLADVPQADSPEDLSISLRKEPPPQ